MYLNNEIVQQKHNQNKIRMQLEKNQPTQIQFVYAKAPYVSYLFF